MIYFVWYPPPYFTVASASYLMLLVMGIDIIIGPFLTFAVFVPGKKSLKFDLAVIAALQIAALVYGLHVIIASRPVYLLATTHYFKLVTSQEIEDADIKEAKFQAFADRPMFGPRLAGLLPPSMEEREKNPDPRMDVKDAAELPKYYVPYQQVADAIFSRAAPLEKLRKIKAKKNEAVDRFVATHGGNIEEFSFVPLQGPLAAYTLILSRSDKQPVGVLDVQPW